MSAFAVAIGGKADMALCTAYVRLRPKADIGASLNGPRFRHYDAVCSSGDDREATRISRCFRQRGGMAGRSACAAGRAHAAHWRAH